jgi:acetyl-CoA carboxylase alpha subunit
MLIKNDLEKKLNKAVKAIIEEVNEQKVVLIIRALNKLGYTLEYLKKYRKDFMVLESGNTTNVYHLDYLLLSITQEYRDGKIILTPKYTGIHIKEVDYELK